MVNEDISYLDTVKMNQGSQKKRFVSIPVHLFLNYVPIKGFSLNKTIFSYRKVVLKMFQFLSSGELMMFAT